jgi:hypothetical protein
VDRGRANAGETAECIDLAARFRSCSELPGISWRFQMQNLAHFAILTWPGPPPHPHPPFPLKQHELTMEVAATSQMRS